MIKKINKKEKLAIVASVVYIAIMAVGMFVLNSVVGESYGSANMPRTLIYFEVVMTLWAVFMYMKYFRGMSFNRLIKCPIKTFPTAMFLVFFILLIVIAAYQFASANYEDKDIGLLLIIIFTTLLVGVSEELIFRGIVLPALMENRSRFVAVLVSSLAFSSLHAVNILGGLSLKEMITQLVMTAFAGLFFALIAIELGNILPIMIYHWFWDGILMTGSYLETSVDGALIVFFLIEAIYVIYRFIRYLIKR